jgi:serine/threonine-protein kinase
MHQPKRVSYLKNFKHNRGFKVNPSPHFTCPHCHANCSIAAETIFFCPLCGKPLNRASPDNASLIRNRYQIIDHIGKGGMGEVLLVYDTDCQRQIALKRIRPDLTEYPQVRSRFLKEAHITCQLTHPAIIPIYTIQSEEAYYTMPFVEGQTLKQIIRKARQQEKNGESPDHTGSILAFMRIFITICQAVAYAHSKGVLHRDLKLENIIIGKYGEVLILDWGLAKYVQTPEEENGETNAPSTHPEITRMGKVVGTIAYMAPERALGQPATIQTDIYSLGVILYQMLTLHPPFKRDKTLSKFKKNLGKEKWIDPIFAAPHRDIPRMLSRMTEKSLALDLKERYATVDELIDDVENYIEGRSDWFLMNQLDINQKSDWEFQENILIAEHIAITRVMEAAEWVSLMISHSSFSGNIKMETEVYLQEAGHGIGFLLSIPESSERTHLSDGYCLWIGSDLNRSTKLLRSNVEVMQAPDIVLKRNQWYRIRIEKIEQSIHLYIDDTLQLSYIAYIPLIGTHVGLLSRDADFEIKPLQIYVGSLNIMVNCLAVPDAFLAHRDFNQALSEYRRIAYSFPDRSEGREAIFRGGLTLIEQSKTSAQKEALLDQAREEFEKLHLTPGAPLEYLGKALIYQALDDEEEEIKCFELAYRRYPKHPILPILKEQIISRMHEVSRYQRIAAYQFILLATRHLPLAEVDTHTRRLFTSLQKHWEYLPFMEEDSHKDKVILNLNFTTQLSFWLAKPYILGEIIDDLSSYPVELGNALFGLIELGSWQYAKHKIEQMQEEPPNIGDNLNKAIACHEHSLESTIASFFPSIPNQMDFQTWRALWYCLNYALDQHQTHLVHFAAKKLMHCELSFEHQLYLNIQRIWAYLLEKNWQAAGEIISAYPFELLTKESSHLHFIYGCWLRATEGKEIAEIHYSALLNVPYPRSWTLGSHYLADNISLNGLWFRRAFLWEKRQLFRQLSLYYACAGDTEKQEAFQQLYKQQFIHADP